MVGDVPWMHTTGHMSGPFACTRECHQRKLALNPTFRVEGFGDSAILEDVSEVVGAWLHSQDS